MSLEEKSLPFEEKSLPFEEERLPFKTSPVERLARMIALALVLIVSGCSGSESAGGQANRPEIIVAAAADLIPAFEEIGRLFERETGTKVTFSFGSTGLLAKQIKNGAPMDLFAAANLSFVEELEREGLILPDTKALYARGRITLWTRADSAFVIDRMEDLAHADVQRIAIAHPDHAPYGIAAREALRSSGIYDTVAPKLVFGENVRQALQYAETGNVDLSIVALSLSVQSKGRWTLIPDHLHEPIDQALAIIKGTRHEREAREFASFINNPQGRAVMRKYGFILPGEEPAH